MLVSNCGPIIELIFTLPEQCIVLKSSSIIKYWLHKIMTAYQLHMYNMTAYIHFNIMKESIPLEGRTFLPVYCNNHKIVTRYNENDDQNHNSQLQQSCNNQSNILHIICCTVFFCSSMIQCSAQIYCINMNSTIK